MPNVQSYFEQDPNQMVQNVKDLMEEVSKEMMYRQLSPNLVKCVGITNQRESCVAWCSQTHQALHNCITWLDQRECKGLQNCSAQTLNLITVMFFGLFEVRKSPGCTWMDRFPLTNGTGCCIIVRASKIVLPTDA